jgi:hypothetical protein
MLAASGARLERLEVSLPSELITRGEGLVHLAQALRCCAPTLKVFRLETEPRRWVKNECEQLREEWGELLAGVSCCRELEVLALPTVKIEPLFPPGTAFDRLTHLDISDFERDHPSGAGVMGLWELMASGGLPALAKLQVVLRGRWEGADEVKRRVGPAFETVAGTLTRLYLATYRDDAWVAGVGYELGVAVGKLRRLKDLALDFSKDGQAYHAVAQGVAASGGDRPLPLLWRVEIIPGDVQANAHLLASLLPPSVRIFICDHESTQGALLTACGLRQVGYEHLWVSWLDDFPPEVQAAVRAISVCRFDDMEVHARMLPLDKL